MAIFVQHVPRDDAFRQSVQIQCVSQRNHTLPKMYLLTAAVQQQCPLLRYLVCELFSIGVVESITSAGPKLNINVRAFISVIPSDPLWPSLVHAGPHWSTLVHTGPYWSILVHTGPHWSTLVHTGPHWSTLVHAGPLWSTLVHSGSLISRSCKQLT